MSATNSVVPVYDHLISAIKKIRHYGIMRNIQCSFTCDCKKVLVKLIVLIQPSSPVSEVWVKSMEYSVEVSLWVILSSSPQS